MLMDSDSAVELEMRDTKVLDLLMDADRDDPWAYANLGGVNLVQENYTAASEFYAKAVWLLEVANKLNDRDYPTILANYAFALGKTGDKRQAAKLLKEAEKRGYTNCAYIRKQLKLSLFDKLF